MLNEGLDLGLMENYYREWPKSGLKWLKRLDGNMRSCPYLL